MKNPTFILWALIMSISLNTYGQYCGTTMTDSEYERLSERAIANRLSDSETAYFNTMQSIPVQVHIVRKNDGTGGISINDINASFDIVNKRYAAASMRFDQCGSANYINNSSYYSYLSSATAAEREMENTYSIDNVINIYFLPNPHSGGSSVCGYAYYPSGEKQLIVMNNACVYGGSTLAHELGHYFNLIHTHGQYNNSLTQELVNGSNCASTGDLICDTPADPQLIRYNPESGRWEYYVNADCDYFGNIRDANNQYYNPNTRNLMSYSLNWCTDHFSAGQIERIQHAYLYYRNYLQCGSDEPEVVICDVVKNGSFTNGSDNWIKYVNSNAYASDYSGYGNAYLYNINGGTEPWHVQFYQRDLRLEGNSRYILSFDARATNYRDVTIDVNDVNAPANSLVHETIKLTTQWERRYIVFETKAAFNNARLVFNLGKNNSSVLIDDVKIEKETCIEYCNYIDNSNFDGGSAYYTTYVNSAANAYAYFSSNGGNMHADYSISNPGTSVWHVQHIQKHFPIKAGKYYTISYKARSVYQRPISIDISNTDYPHSGYFYHTQYIDNIWRTYNHTFYSNVNASDVRLVFNLGKYTGSVALDDIMVVERDCNSINNSRLETELDDFNSINATAYPNPFKDQINISFDTFMQESTIQIYNIQGKLVSEGQYNFSDNANQIIPTSELKNGIYIVKIQAPYGEAQTFKMVKE